MLALVLVLAQGPRFVELRTGMAISQSMLVATKVYRLSGPPIVIRGDNIIVDFRGATLEGTASDADPDRKSTRLNSSHVRISYAVFCLKKKNDDTETIVLVAAVRMTQASAVHCLLTSLLSVPD